MTCCCINPLGPFAMCEAFPRSDYYGPSAPPQGHRLTTRQPDLLSLAGDSRSGTSRWSGSPGALRRLGPLRTVRATLIAHGSGKP